MNFIENGDFESGTTYPWTKQNGSPLEFEIVSANNKKWLHTDGFNGPANGYLQQIVPKTDTLWGPRFRLTFTAKAIPTGGTKKNGAQSDSDVSRLRGELIVHFNFYPLLYPPNSGEQGGVAIISVKETTYSHHFTLNRAGPVNLARLAIINWGVGDTDKADILITDIKLEVDNSPVDPEDPDENERTIDLSNVGLGVINVSPMKEVK